MAFGAQHEGQSRLGDRQAGEVYRGKMQVSLLGVQLSETAVQRP